jgi:hypothetical protein
MGEAVEEKEIRRRPALAQARRALRGRQDRPAYESDAREIALASIRFATNEELGLAIFKIFQKHYGQKMRKFDTFALAGRLLEEFGRKLEG